MKPRHVSESVGVRVSVSFGSSQLVARGVNAWLWIFDMILAVGVGLFWFFNLIHGFLT